VRPRGVHPVHTIRPRGNSGKRYRRFRTRRVAWHRSSLTNKQEDSTAPLVPLGFVGRRILVLREQKVMLDRDLAELYGVETRVLNQAVRRNKDRFPPDFMLALTREEIADLS
jgi:hypothetical protein